MSESWMVPGAIRDAQSITRDWLFVDGPSIDGVTVRAISNVMSGYGRLTEIHRSEWDDEPVDQVFQSVLEPDALSAWHAHEVTLDRLFCGSGRLLVVLHDTRPDSPTLGRTDVVRVGEHQPGVVRVPPKVWHGVKNIGTTPALLVNAVDRAYAYEQPDHYRLVADSPEIPFDILSAV